MYFKAVGMALVILFVIWFAIIFGLPAYDRYTKAEITKLIESELNFNSGQDAMQSFMQNHVDRYHLDNVIDFEYAGILKQSNMDKVLFDRKVGVKLIFDPSNEKFIGFKVDVYYTFM